MECIIRYPPFHQGQFSSGGAVQLRPVQARGPSSYFTVYKHRPRLKRSGKIPQSTWQELSTETSYPTDHHFLQPIPTSRSTNHFHRPVSKSFSVFYSFVCTAAISFIWLHTSSRYVCAGEKVYELWLTY